MRVPGTVSFLLMRDRIVVHRSAPEAIMAGRSAGIHRVPRGVGTARRAIGGTLMALGAAAAIFLALMSVWMATELLGDIVWSAPVDPAEVWGPLKVIASGALAATLCALLAWIGRLILGPRPPV